MDGDELVHEIGQGLFGAEKHRNHLDSAHDRHGEGDLGAQERVGDVHRHQFLADTQWGDRGRSGPPAYDAITQIRPTTSGELTTFCSSASSSRVSGGASTASANAGAERRCSPVEGSHRCAWDSRGTRGGWERH